MLGNSHAEHIAALSDQHVANCANAIHSLVYQADNALTELWKFVQPDGPEIKTETSKSITMDQLDELTLPLGKARSILELFVDDLPADLSNGGIVAQTLISEVRPQPIDATHWLNRSVEVATRKRMF